MQRVLVYSDESKHRGPALFVVAGVIISGYFDVVRQELLKAEQDSGKGAVKWQRTTPKIRRRYLEAVLNIRHLRRSAFYRAYPDPPNHPVNPFWSTADTLEHVVRQRKAGERTMLIHQGLNYQTRQNLGNYLKHIGLREFSVEAGSMAKEPRVRLADALAGFSALLHSNSVTLDEFNGLPYNNWFTEI